MLWLPKHSLFVSEKARKGANVQYGKQAVMPIRLQIDGEDCLRYMLICGIPCCVVLVGEGGAARLSDYFI